MTLGRTSSGAIKIKTDSAGGGLRAVECACCGPVAACYHCYQVKVTGQLLDTLRNATSGICNGAVGFFNKFMGVGDFVCEWPYAWFGFDAWAEFEYETGCFTAYYSAGTPESGAVINLGDCIDLCSETHPPGCSIAPNVLVNGLPFPAYYVYSGNGGPLPPQPEFIFL